jgi:hypothetical protein
VWKCCLVWTGNASRGGDHTAIHRVRGQRLTAQWSVAFIASAEKTLAWWLAATSGCKKLAAPAFFSILIHRFTSASSALPSECLMIHRSRPCSFTDRRLSLPAASWWPCKPINRVEIKMRQKAHFHWFTGGAEAIIQLTGSAFRPPIFGGFGDSNLWLSIQGRLQPYLRQSTRQGRTVLIPSNLGRLFEPLTQIDSPLR